MLFVVSMLLAVGVNAATLNLVAADSTTGFSQNERSTATSTKVQ
ncbi:MAG: pectate lyase [Oleiphilaceae bacterium]|jgi:pectate lyase